MVTIALLRSICLDVDSMGKHRRVKLFREDRNQAVHIPVEFELLGNEAIVRRNEKRPVIEPVRKCGLVSLLKSMEPLSEGFPEIEDPVPVR